MDSRAITRAVGLLLLALVATRQLSIAQTDLRYQKRGHYSEGTRTSPSTGATVDLIGALINEPEPHQDLPLEFRALFYLPNNEQVHLTIRESTPEYLYWLGDAEPGPPWRPKELNEFVWSTKTVIRSLNWKRPLGLEDLAAVVRLGRITSGKVERVAPVALYHRSAPQSVDSYRFVFRPSTRMRLKFDVFAGDQTTPSATQAFPRAPAENTLPVIWDASEWADGWYRVQITGYSGSGRVDSEVRFYHRSTLRP